MGSGQATSERGTAKKNADKTAGDAHRPADAEGQAPGLTLGSGQGPEVATEGALVSADRPGHAEGAGELPRDRYLDREESWLRFNQRVLELAEDESLALLERVRFLSIFASNLDEFFMVRVAGRMRRMAAGLPVERASGHSPAQILENTLDFAGELTRRQAECFSDSVLPALEREGIEILR